MRGRQTRSEKINPFSAASQTYKARAVQKLQLAVRRPVSSCNQSPAEKSVRHLAERSESPSMAFRASRRRTGSIHIYIYILHIFTFTADNRARLGPGCRGSHFADGNGHILVNKNLMLHFTVDYDKGLFFFLGPYKNNVSQLKSAGNPKNGRTIPRKRNIYIIWFKPGEKRFMLSPWGRRLRSR